MSCFTNLNRNQRYRLISSGVVVGISCLFILLFMIVQPFTTISSFLTDQLFAAEPPSPNIIIIGIDDSTLKTYGKWSEWPRSLHTKAIHNLSTASALVIGFDVLFADSSVDDPAFTQEIERAGNVVLAAVGVDAYTPTQPLLIYKQFLLPAAPLERASYCIGHGNFTPDGDGVVRRLPLIAKDNTGQIVPSLSLAMLYAAFAETPPEEYSLEPGKLHLVDRDIPVDKYQRIRINYTDPNKNYNYLSYVDAIRGDFDPSMVKNKIVIIGMTATGDLDTWETPVLPSKKPGVWIHANVLDGILRQRFLVDSDWPITLLTMLVFMAVTAFALPRLKLKWGAVLTVGLIIGYAGVSFAIFDLGYILNLLYPSMLLPLAYVATVICFVVSERSHKQLVKDLFGRYISPQVASKICELDDNGKLRLGGERHKVTVLFADIKGFTRMSEQMAPEEVVNMLNVYLSIIIGQVTQNNGIVNKFAGDNIMGVWNAPQAEPKHALLAVKSAMEAQQAIVKKQQEDPSLPKVQFGIGINTGDAVAGNIGSIGRAEYTVIGDAVNVASRICSVALGGEVWIGAETYEQVKDDVEIEQLPAQSFKGKMEPVVVYKVLALK